MVRVARYQSGAVIIAEGAESSEAYFLERGRVEVFQAGPPRRRLAVLEAGDIFGEMGVITGQSRSATVQALDEVEVWVVEREDFLPYLQANPDALARVLRILCERVRVLNAQVATLAAHAAGGPH